MNTMRPVQGVVGLFVVGTRPEAIKMLPLIVAARRDSRFRPVVVSTGQHAELVREVLALGGVEPDVTFDRPAGNYTLNDLFSHVMSQFDAFFRERFGEPVPPARARYAQGYPAACFVHGDTTSAAAAALASFHLQLPVVHVEAGLRTGDTLTPFPEELNRQMISRIASLHLAPTHRNKANLTAEQVDPRRVFVTGNTGIDALQLAARATPPSPDTWTEGQRRLRDVVDEAPSAPLVVVTAHRRENWGEPLARIAEAVDRLARSHPEARFVVATHPNPAVAEVMTRRLSPTPEDARENVLLIPPLDYRPFARLLGHAAFALTDSGGVQEEAPALGTPVLCLRESTERQEGVDAGTVTVVGTRTERIVAAAEALLDDPAERARRRALPNPYGDGRAAQRIMDLLAHVVFDEPEPASFGSGIDRRRILAGAGALDPTAARPVVAGGELAG
jgi:UDP-N-acetylglucosamine 2-epimerase (non-hydrolysing)